VWLTGLPHTEANSRLVTVTDLRIHGNTDRLATNLLLQLMSTDAVREQIDASLTETSTRTTTRSRQGRRGDRRQAGRPLPALGDDRFGTHEAIQVTGAGLFTPAVVTGRGQITIGPRQAGLAPAADCPAPVTAWRRTALGISRKRAATVTR
jgi:hypothetical protein